jgi:glucosamine--fructose-6-phosphate aminotransferase (isomerizing)
LINRLSYARLLAVNKQKFKQGIYFSMCGIVGYLGPKEAVPVIIDGLHRLEYRGYDSAGIAVVDNRRANIVKRQGRVDELAAALRDKHFTATLGIGHTRWATHGIPNEVNAHPQQSADGRVILVHNGIIENYVQLKTGLLKQGITFKSETDTEVLANLIAIILSNHKKSLFTAVQEALKLVQGAYAIAVLDSQNTDTLVVAKKSSPLVVGLGQKEFIVGSDATPIVAHTRKVLYLNDDEVAELKRNGTYQVISLTKNKIDTKIQRLELSVDKLAKNNYPHFMLKEIHEQPDAIRNTMRGRLNLTGNTVILGGINDYEQRILRAPRLTIVACGTSWHAGLVGKYLIEELAGIPVDVELASEFRYRSYPLNNYDVVLAISQSGETADTLAALRLAQAKGALTLGLVNVVGSTIARTTLAGVYTHAGPEISVASTKAFTTQVTALTLMAMRFAQQLGNLPNTELHKLFQQFSLLPTQVEATLKHIRTIKEIIPKLVKGDVIFFLGRGNCYPVALEGALKMKEIAYLSAEGYAAGEMKHGPIALIGPNTPVFVIVPAQGELRTKLLNNIQEVKARNGYVIAVASDQDREIKKQVDVILPVPAVANIFLPIIAAIPLQLAAYYTAVQLGNDVDKPRNLAKSVTVE